MSATSTLRCVAPDHTARVSLTLWYPRHTLQFRIGLFVGSVSFALAFSGLLAFIIQFMDGIRGLEGWSWIFVCKSNPMNTAFTSFQILEGIATVVVGILAALLLVDYPATATFITHEEREFLAWKKGGYLIHSLHLPPI